MAAETQGARGWGTLGAGRGPRVEGDLDGGLAFPLGISKGLPGWWGLSSQGSTMCARPLLLLRPAFPSV